MAFSHEFIALTRPATDSITSTHENCRRRIPSASSQALSCHSSSGIGPPRSFPVVLVGAQRGAELVRERAKGVRLQLLALGIGTNVVRRFGRRELVDRRNGNAPAAGVDG